MADLTTSLIVRATAYRDQIVRQTNRSAPLFSILPKRTARNSTANYGIEYAGATADYYAEGANVGTGTSDNQTSVSLALANIEQPFTVTDKALAAAKVNGVPGNEDQWERQIINGSAAMAKKIEAELFAGTGVGSTERIIGLPLWIDDSQTVAGIDRSSGANSYWRATVIDSGSPVTLTKALVYNDLATVANAGGERPNLAVCNPLVFAKIQALFDSNVVVINNWSNVTGQQVLGSPSLPVIMINGCAFIEASDGYANTVGDIWYLNTDHIWLEVLPEQALAPGFEDMQIPAMEGTVDYDMFSAGFCYKAVGRTAHAKKAVVSAMLQLCIDKPNCFGARRDVSLA